MIKLKQTLNRVVKGVRSFGIITAEKTASIENRARQDDLKKNLKNRLIQYTQINGKYGNLENPFVVININKDELIEFAGKFQQESIIFAVNYFDYIEFQYWQQKGAGDFKLLDTSNYHVNLEEFENFFSYKKDWKLNIPFSIFEEINKQYSHKYRDLSKDALKYIEELNGRIATEDNKTMRHFVELRGRINYLLKEQPMKMINRRIVNKPRL